MAEKQPALHADEFGRLLHLCVGDNRWRMIECEAPRRQGQSFDETIHEAIERALRVQALGPKHGCYGHRGVGLLPNYWLSRKNCCGPEMGLVTVFWPLATTGAAEKGVQIAGKTRFVVDCRVKPMASEGQVKIKPARA